MTVNVTEEDLAQFDPENMTLAQWEGFEAEHRHEVVAGVLIVSPTGTLWDRLMVSRLAGLISPTAAAVEWLTGVEVLLAPGPSRPTVRCPDLVVVRRGAVGDVPRLDPRDVLLSVQVVSPGSRETDWVTKRAEYAAAGIPAYLVVDRHRERIVLFDSLADGAYTRRTVDPGGTGGTVVLDLAGTPLPLTLADLTS